MIHKNSIHTRDYLKLIGVPDMPPLTSPFDPGYDPATLESHLEQSSHLMVDPESLHGLLDGRQGRRHAPQGGRRNEASRAHSHRRRPVRNRCGARLPSRVPGPVRRHRLHADRMRRRFHRHAAGRARGDGDGRTDAGSKYSSSSARSTAAPSIPTLRRQLIAQGRRWLDAGARELVVEARESAKGVGLFDDSGRLQRRAGRPVRQ